MGGPIRRKEPYRRRLADNLCMQCDSELVNNGNYMTCDNEFCYMHGFVQSGLAVHDFRDFDSTWDQALHDDCDEYED